MRFSTDRCAILKSSGENIRCIVAVLEEKISIATHPLVLKVPQEKSGGEVWWERWIFNFSLLTNPMVRENHIQSVFSFQAVVRRCSILLKSTFIDVEQIDHRWHWQTFHFEACGCNHDRSHGLEKTTNNLSPLNELQPTGSPVMYNVDQQCRPVSSGM